MTFKMPSELTEPTPSPMSTQLPVGSNGYLLNNSKLGTWLSDLPATMEPLSEMLKTKVIEIYPLSWEPVMEASMLLLPILTPI